MPTKSGWDQAPTKEELAGFARKPEENAVSANADAADRFAFEALAAAAQEEAVTVAPKPSTRTICDDPSEGTSQFAVPHKARTAYFRS